VAFKHTNKSKLMATKTLFIAAALIATCSAAFFSSTTLFAPTAEHQKTQDNSPVEVRVNQGVKVERVSNQDTKSPSEVKVEKVPGTITKYMLTFGGEVKNTVNVKVFDSEGSTIFEDQHSIDGTEGVVYTMEQTGVYTFEVTDKKGDSHLFME